MVDWLSDDTDRTVDTIQKRQFDSSSSFNMKSIVAVRDCCLSILKHTKIICDDSAYYVHAHAYTCMHMHGGGVYVIAQKVHCYHDW